MGSTIMPDSERLTLSTSAACRSMVMFLWIIPMPPCWANAMANRRSVTVSIAADRNGMLSSMVSVSRVLSSTSWGRTSDLVGMSSTSSNVSPSKSGNSSMFGPPDRFIKLVWVWKLP